MIRILLVDDHALFRSGMRSILDAQEGLTIIEAADNGEAAVELMRENPADVVLMDVNMPGIGGIEATRRIVRYDPESKVIALTAMDELPFPNQLLDAGAVGYLTKGCSADELSSAVKQVVQGKHYICNEVAQRLSLSSLINKGKSTPVETLSAREMQVMLMVTKGNTTQEISDSLYLSPKTISTYRTRLFEKLGVHNDVELTHFALTHGLIELNG
jgi:two-component system invasion response regulator UvrY